MSISPLKLRQLVGLIAAGKEDVFYSWPEWDETRFLVLRLDNYECQICKAKGRYRRGKIVHHVQHLKDRPDLALSIWDSGQRQLITVCKRCHEELHPESKRQYKGIKETITVERWD